jgi:hypothetical protein
MIDKLLTMFCLVDGDSVSFSVDIDASKTVDHLKDKIKTEKAPEFDDIAAYKLSLWKVSIPLPPKKDRKVIWLSDVAMKDELDETDVLSHVFKEPPPMKTIHIIVRRPPHGTAHTRLLRFVTCCLHRLLLYIR